MRADLDTLVTALYVTIDELLGPRRGPGRRPKLSDAELVCLAVAQVLLGSVRAALAAVRRPAAGAPVPVSANGLGLQPPLSSGRAAGRLGHPGHRCPHPELGRPAAAGRLDPGAVCLLA